MVFSSGHITGISGPLGLGKSTVFNLITGIICPSRGRVIYDGSPYDEIDIVKLRKKTGYVTQEDIVFNDTIINNLTLWQNADREKVEGLIEKYGFENFIKDMPQGYDTILGESGIKVSGGQRSFIFFIREMLKNPDILLLDEFTGSMDESSEGKIMNILKEEAAYRIIILISHRITSFRYCGSIYVLDKDKSVWEGKYDDFRTRFFSTGE